jgi:hypothetical protein
VSQGAASRPVSGSRRAAAALAASLLLCGVAAPAWAPAATAATTQAVDQAALDRAYVRRIAQTDSRQLVRTAAWQALLNSNVDAAVAKFLAPGGGYDFAKKLSASNANKNLDFCQRVVGPYTAQWSPEVHAAAQYALDHSSTDREAFVRSGFAAAKNRDRVFREADAQHLAAVAEEDRAYVATLRDIAPGAAVKLAAAYATRPIATDADIRDFFASTWADAGKVDLDSQRQSANDADVVRRAAAERLVAQAQAAEQAALVLEGEARQAQLQAAAQAWGSVAANATAGQSSWTQLETFAVTQVANWQDVLTAALAATGDNWAAIAGPAGQSVTDWTGEQSWAHEQADYWTQLLELARASEQQDGAITVSE